MIQPPDPRRLTRAWGLLVILTVASLLAGRAGEAGSLGLLGSAVVLAVAAFKAQRILMDFLNLRAAPAGWRTVLTLWPGLTAAAIWLTSAVPLLIAR